MQSSVRWALLTTDPVTGTQGTPATEQVYDFDKIGQVVKHQQKIDNQSYLLEYGYNLAGQLISEKYPSGRIVNVSYDANGRLSSVADAQRTYLSGVAFNSQTLPSQMNFGNGTNQTFGFNDRLQMTNQTLSRSSETLQKYDYGYGQIDSNGNLDTSKNNGQLARVESHIGTAKQWTQKFKYDSIGRLSETEEKRGDTNALTYKQKFDFDKFGNLYRKNASNPTSGQENPLSFAPIEDGDINKATNRLATNTTYDEAGNVTQDNKFRNINFSYDANGRMFKTSNIDNTNQANSVYDASGNRVATKIADVWTFLIYDAFGKMVAEYGGLQSSDEGGVKYVLQDWQGSVRGVLNNSGFVQSRTDYQAFGEEIQSGIGLRTSVQGFGAENNLIQKYASTERDKATGLDHTWFRKNENKAGRWTSPDPYNGSMSLSNPQSFNRYSYVENEPTNFVDPSGLQLRYYDVSQGMSCVLKEDGIFHCTEYINRYWYDDGIGNYNPSDGGGFDGGDGIGDGDNISEDNVSENCVKVLKNKGLWNKILKADKNATFFDVDKIQDQPASKYFGSKGTKGLTVGQYFDRLGHDAFAFVRGSGGITGIYSRGGEDSLSPNLRLHEVSHLAYPVGSDLDISLARKLGLQVNKGQSASSAISNYFKNDCDPSLLKKKKGRK